MDNWYPLTHDTWAEVGIVASVAPAPDMAFASQPVSLETEQSAPGSEGHATAERESELLESGQGGLEQNVVEATPEKAEKAFSEYAEEDFKPPSFDEMDQEMSSLRSDREALPGLIGERAFDAGIEDEEIEDAKAEVAKARQSCDQSAIQLAHRELGRLIMVAGIHDASLTDLRDREQDLSDRMLNLQMQARRMGGGTRVKKNKPWMKWVVVVLALVLVGGTIAIANLLE